MAPRPPSLPIPTRRRPQCLLLASALALGMLACQESKTCERQRLDLFKAWQDVNQAIEQQKLSGGSDEAQWATIQKKVDVLQSAFATTQVTWDSASKNKDEATTLLTSVGQQGIKTEMFRATFDAAGAKQAAYYDTCR